ncbi:MAG: murein biosynthesis integral membrane protein MurJ [Firmicutes bacterium]|nr:murein biosynthesis integral membrane protein MurJ [Bacillota bacterium]
MTKNLIKASGLLLIINICVKLLSFGREMVIADGFGASFLTDAYLAAYTIPYFFQTILGYAFVSAVLPALSECWQETGDNSRACRLGSSIINITAAFMLLLTIIGLFAAPELVWLTAPGLPDETAALAAELARIIFPSMLFMSIGLVISGILNSRYRFAAAAIAPGVCSLVIILSVMLIAGGDIYALAWGTLAGFIAFFLVHLADLPHTGFKYSFSWDFKDPALKRVMADIIPIVIGLSVNQIYTVINRIFASSLAEGSIAALNYASKLMNLPLGIFVAAIITAAFPSLAEKANLSDKTPLRQICKKGLSMVLLIAIPSAVGLMLLGNDIVQLLFERGNFTAADTLMTAQCLIPMAPGLIFIAVNMLLMRVYFALHDVRTPVLTGVISIAVNVGLSLALVGLMGNAGLSLSNTIAAAVNAVLLTYYLNKKIDLLSDGYLRKMLLQACLACLIMAVPVLLGQWLLPAASSVIGLLVKIGGLIVVAIGIYFLVLKFLHCDALDDIIKSLRKSKA